MNLEKAMQPIADEIYTYYETMKSGGFRPHLGASILGEECTRKLWYSFRWCKAPKFPGRILVLFETGQREEDRIVNMLRDIGLVVYDRDPEDPKKQIRIEQNCHISGSLDGMVEYNNKWHVLEIKTHNDNQFKILSKKGVEVSHPKHYAQMQVYMYKTGVNRALYVAKNKNDESIYTERIKLDELYGAMLIRKAINVVSANRPLEKLGKNQADYRCKFCDYIDICHQKQIVKEINCRTCVHSTAIDAGWKCDLHVECNVCDDHKFIPDLVPLEQVDAGENYIEYEGGIKNGPDFMSSRDLILKVGKKC